MTPGRLARRLLGNRGSRVVGGAYRALFVDIGKVVEAISRRIPAGAHVLDVGGGDGAIVNLLLAHRADICVTTIDVAPVVGQWIDAAHADRIVRLPHTTLADYLASSRPLPQVLLMTDVMHHVPPGERGALLKTISDVMRAAPSLRIIVKDVEPGYFRARLGYLSDRYITGDREVRLVSRSELIAAMRGIDQGICWSETDLFANDKPNYALVFWR
ncbi:MAG TPA: class I SAM-dependent methyltransferase [Casimicrobiaceae bacterium]|nr:class I SAM-dependent methyltransferase [Casimicrobiaceae bacterium]